jgi:hypothetical protein
MVNSDESSPRQGLSLGKIGAYYRFFLKVDPPRGRPFVIIVHRNLKKEKILLLRIFMLNDAPV